MPQPPASTLKHLSLSDRLLRPPALTLKRLSLSLSLDPQAPQPQPLTLQPAPPAHQTSQQTSQLQHQESELSFYVYYSEASEAHKFSFAPASLSKDAVELAVASAGYSLCQRLNVKKEDLLAKPSFPTSFGQRQFTMQEWTEIGKGPHVDIIMVDPASSLKRQRDVALRERDEANAAKEKAQKVAHEVTFQSLMVSDEPKAVKGECVACPKLRERVKHLELRIEQQQLQIEQQQLQIAHMELDLAESRGDLGELKRDAEVQRQVVNHILYQVSELCKDRDRSRKVLLRIVLSEAREKALSQLGKARPPTTSWAVFFADHEQQLKQMSMQMSIDLLELLKHGGHVLNKAAHLASRKKQAKAVLELQQGNQRLAFSQAFLYAYGENAEDYFEQ